MIQSFVQFPDPLQAAILALVTFVVGFLFTQIANALPWLGAFLGQYKVEISMAVSGALVTVIQNLLNAIPAQYDNVVTIALQLLIAVLASFGFFKFFEARGARGFRAG
jgi:hypothetical protein